MLTWVPYLDRRTIPEASGQWKICSARLVRNKTAERMFPHWRLWVRRKRLSYPSVEPWEPLPACLRMLRHSLNNETVHMFLLQAKQKRIQFARGTPRPNARSG